MANVPQLGAPGSADDSQEMPCCKGCGQAIFFEHAADCPVILSHRKGDVMESGLAEAWWRGRRSVYEGVPKTEATGPELVRRCKADITELFAPECGEDHEVGSRPNYCFACLSEQRDELLQALKLALSHIPREQVLSLAWSKTYQKISAAIQRAEGALEMARRWRPKSEDELLAELERAVDRYESDAAAARAFGVSRGHLSRVLRREKPMTANIAHCLGYEQQRWYVRYEERR